MMTRTVDLFLLLSLLCCFSLSPSGGLEGAHAEGFTVEDVKGNAWVTKSGSDTLSAVEVGTRLLAQQFVTIETGAALKLKPGSGDVVVLQGPVEGTVHDLLSARLVRAEGFVRSTLDKIPAAQRGERKVGISTPSAGLTRGAKSRTAKMPYIWKIQRRPKQAEKK